jgi:hypothetical protein
MPYPNFCGRKRVWTREKVLAALAIASRQIKGPLPCFDKDYRELKRGRLDWPPSRCILEYFHSMARAWLTAGAERKRITFSNVDWSKKEDDFLLEHAGDMTLQDIATHLHRSYQGARSRLNKFHRLKARANQGFISAAEVAKEFKCPYHRIRKALRLGKIKGRFDPRRNRWEVDLVDILHSPVAQAIVKRPKRTHKRSPTDLGDYCQRHGLKRVLVGGKTKYVRVLDSF